MYNVDTFYNWKKGNILQTLQQFYFLKRAFPYQRKIMHHVVVQTKWYLFGFLFLHCKRINKKKQMEKKIKLTFWYKTTWLA